MTILFKWLHGQKRMNRKTLPLNKTTTNSSLINQFIPRIQAIVRGQTWGEIRLLHTKSYLDILYETGLWLKSKGHGLFFKELQAENVRNVGWLLWSFRSLDAKLLSKELHKIFGIEVSFCYSLIAVDNSPRNPEKQVRALHIVAQSGADYDITKKIL